jgi:hypothetical protein
LQIVWRWAGGDAIEIVDEAGQRWITRLLQKDIRVTLTQSHIARVSM